MNKAYFFFLILLISSCRQKITQQDIEKLNGYWEIEKVVFTNGKEKKYAVNETFDYIQIKDNKGFRKKVTPQFDGTFLVDNQSEQLTVMVENDKTYLSYSTSYSKWKEELLSISNEKMTIINSDTITYNYKKAKPINLLEDGKKTK
ncbi:MAG: lipocalin family protein [Bacteroidota bacterium]